MKKGLLLWMMSMCMMVMTAQTTLTNAGFETWSTSGTLTQEQPDGWTIALVGNVVVEMFGVQVPVSVNTYFGSKTTDAYEGSYALMLQPNTVGITGTDYSTSCPAIAQYGTATGFNLPLSTIMEIVSLFQGDDTTGIDINNIDFESLTTLADILAPGDALSQTPSHLNMWVKYVLEGTESVRIIAYTKQGGLPVGTASYRIEEPISTYTQISIPFENALDPCDTLSIFIIAGNLTNTTTTLYVDDITIDYNSSGVTDRSENIFSLTPNPTSGQFFIRPAEESDYAYVMYDMQGRRICAEKNCSGVTRVNTSNLSKGVYVVQIQQNGQKYPQKMVVR